MERQHVSCLCEWSEGGIISGSKDGTVRRWDLALKEIGKPIDVGSLSSSPAGSHSVICVRADSAGNKLVVGTRSSDIIQLTFKGTASSDLRPKEKTLVTGHCVSAALCVATHPTMGEFATCGADCTLRVWNAKTKKCVSERLPSTGSAVSYSADGNHLAVGLNNGELIVMQTTAGYRKVTTLILTDAETQAKKNNYKSKAPRNAISALAYSPDGKSLAVGCAAGYVFIYNIHEGVYVCGSVCDSDGSSVKTIDWSVDSKALQSVDGMGRLIRWDSSGNRVDSASSVKDVLWNTWTCTDGWPVQGARGASSTIVSCARSNDHGEDLLAVGSSAGAIELYKYPCTQSGADVPAKRIYYGHVGNITAIRFLPGGTNLVSISDADGCVLQWACEHEELNREHVARELSDADDFNDAVEQELNRGSYSDNFVPETPRFGSEAASKYFRNINGTFYHVSQERAARDGHLSSCVDASLDLAWVKGYRGSDTRNNIISTDPETNLYILREVP